MGKPIAQHLDEFRVFPRGIMIFYGFMCWNLLEWVQTLPDLSTQQGVFAGAVMGLFVPLCKWYFSTGINWRAENE